MFRRFLFHKAIGDKGLLLILPKPSIYPRLLLGTFVGNVIAEKQSTANYPIPTARNTGRAKFNSGHPGATNSVPGRIHWNPPFFKERTGPTSRPLSWRQTPIGPRPRRRPHVRRLSSHSKAGHKTGKEAIRSPPHQHERAGNATSPRP